MPNSRLAILAGLFLVGSRFLAGAEVISSAGATAREEGRSAYAQHCASCHGADRAGGVGPALKGSNFSARWSGKDAELLRLISASMPLGAGHSLPPATYRKVTEYLSARPEAPSKLARSRAIGSRAADIATATLPAPPQTYGIPTATGPDDAELMSPTEGDWLRYNGDYLGQRYSALAQITPANVASLAPKCIFQTGEVGSFQASPIVHDGTVYVTTAQHTYALDGTTCRKRWMNDYPAIGGQLPSNRGVAIYRGMVIRGTLNCHLIAIDAENGKLVWDVRVCDGRKGAFISAVPVVFDGKLFVGEAGADSGASGHVHGFDAVSGRHLWTFDTVATGKQPGSETWLHGAVPGGGSTWTTITVEPATRTLYVPVGNPFPDLDVSVRQGTNLYTNSVVALDADTGKVRWHVQQNAGDFHDWDTAAAPMIYDVDGRKLMAVGSKDSRLYIYDRSNQKLLARENIGRRSNDTIPLTGAFIHVCPGYSGGIVWNGPAYDPVNRSIFVNAVDWCARMKVQIGKPGGFEDAVMDPASEARGSLRAFDAATGAQRWAFEADSPMLAAITPTASGLVLTGTSSGEFLALSATTGDKLYSFYTGGAVAGGVCTYMVGRKQYVAVVSGNMSHGLYQTPGAATLVIFSLP